MLWCITTTHIVAGVFGGRCGGGYVPLELLLLGPHGGQFVPAGQQKQPPEVRLRVHADGLQVQAGRHSPAFPSPPIHRPVCLLLRSQGSSYFDFFNYLSVAFLL